MTCPDCEGEIPKSEDIKVNENSEESKIFTLFIITIIFVMVVVLLHFNIIDFTSFWY